MIGLGIGLQVSFHKSRVLTACPMDCHKDEICRCKALTSAWHIGECKLAATHLVWVSLVPPGPKPKSEVLHLLKGSGKGRGMGNQQGKAWDHPIPTSPSPDGDTEPGGLDMT